MQEHLDPKALLTEIDARHIYDLDRREQELLAYLWFGYVAEEVAPFMDRTEGSVRRWYADLEHRVLDVTLVPACARFLRTWIDRHLECCARVTREMIENARGA
jgi:hypothetical protein